jgi:hypothetical protein
MLLSQPFIVVVVVRSVGGFFFEDLYVRECCVFNYHRVQDGAEDVSLRACGSGYGGKECAQLSII